MANIEEKLLQNITGPYYVDASCTDCDLCRTTAPGVFRRDDETGYSFVFNQPSTDEERRDAADALENCPTDSIGRDQTQPAIEPEITSSSPNS